MEAKKKKTTKKKTTSKKKVTKKKSSSKKKTSKKKESKKKSEEKIDLKSYPIEKRAQILSAMVQEAVQKKFEPVIKEEAKKLDLDIELNVHLNIKNYSLKAEKKG